MNRKEAIRQTEQMWALEELGFTRDEAESLRRISMTLRRWHELECGTGEGQVTRSVERDEFGRSYLRLQFPMSNGQYHDKRYPTPDRETGARKRLAAIIRDRNQRTISAMPEPSTIVGCAEQACDNSLSAYIQTDPRGAALYILRPGDIPEGQSADSCYSRGICVY
jgi:hypothetical protein